MKGASRFVTAATLSLTLPAFAQDPQSRYFTIVFEPGTVAGDLATRFVSEAVRAADAAGAAAEKLLQTKFTKKPKLVVHADKKTFRSCEKEQSKEPCIVDEFCVPDGSAAHVLVRPLLERALAMQIGLPELTRQGLMRCAAQTLVASHSPQAAADPWLAAIVAFGVLEGLTNPAGTCGVDPHFDERRLWHTVTTLGLPGMDLAPRVADTAPPKDRDGYDLLVERTAMAAQLLAKDGPGWARRLLAKPAKTTDLGAARLRAFESVLGKDWTKTETKWGALRQSSRAVWRPQNEVRAVAKGFQLAGDETTAVLQAAVSLRLPCAVSGTVTMRGETPEFRVELDWDGESLLAVWFKRGECKVQEFTSKGKWKTAPLKQVSAPIPEGQPFDFRIRMTDVVAVTVDGVDVLAVPCGERKMQGSWQVAANYGIVLFENLRIEPLQPAKK